MSALGEAIAAIGPLDEAAMAAARARLDQLTKPVGSLGRLESLAIQLAGITGLPAPSVRPARVIVVAADHGIARRGVSAYPQAVTAQMVANYVAGGAAVNVLARLADAKITVVDAGMVTDVRLTPEAGGRGADFVVAPVRRGGTDDIAEGPAMRRGEALASIELGLATVDGAIRSGARSIAVGEMGIGNTTPASAITSVVTGARVADVTGSGSGIDEARRMRKIGLIERAMRTNRPDPGDPIAILGSVGGFEIGALIGILLGAAAAHVPVLLDGFITGAAALLAAGLAPALPARLIAAHRSIEPGHGVILGHLGLEPLLHLDLRLGEGSGAVLALGILEAACGIRDDMATFETAGVSGRA